jgi:putative DNA primase/helicase
MSDLATMQSRLDKALENATAEAPRYTFYTADQLREFPPLMWRIHGVLPTSGLATIFGPSGAGKSFLLLDLVAAIAEGREWFSLKTEPCRVLYLVLEGKAGVLQRIRAWEKHNGRPYPQNVSFMLDNFRLNSPGDVLQLTTQMEAASGFDMVVIDTLNRAAPNADENSSLAISQLLSEAGKLQEATAGLVILVHHTGKDETRGLRGHSSLFAAMDAAVEVKRNGGERGWRLLKAKDGKDGADYPFKLAEIDLSSEAQGATSSCVIESTAGTGGVFDDGEEVRPKTPNQIAVMERIRNMLTLTSDQGMGGAPPDTPCISAKAMLDQAKAEISGGPKHKPERAREALDWLVTNGLVKREGEWLWIPVPYAQENLD